ncbi:hypothetical protein [Elizabethkingia anophelis]|uniref:hypothetical protein n=1 Tax=Elizabethkingia anophelis TaxID=1117645 RepID=UPI0012B2EE27|nr:hypothetical protein [Elizabethkingia anophelis]QGN24319.1 hypothetical protein GJV56_17255 [Elizabethkingia anophelis]QNV10960.1 hypothetical protein EIY88_17225 [Elizabethkingia anophelis]UTF89114.1 hypothetical protein J2N93_17335 [Elizabethkingia anophelis]UTG00036.1 hypothetical protein J2O04_17550 [Elizabethkingia anophelis]UTG03751.1 hypothetical protein J2O03_17330 [Elizabethkingia anophelis]
MNYAQTYPIGNYHNPRTATTTAIAPTVERVRPLDSKAKRCKRSAERQTQISTDRNVTNGFLKSTFLPKLKETKTVQACGKSDKTERDFFQSLSKLAEHYQIEPMQSKQFPYPYNMALAMSDMEEKLKLKVLDWEEIRLVQDSKKTYFVSEERYNTGSTLFYIPVASLYRMLHNRKRKINAHLLLSVCAYLYHIADIPYYRQEASYLYWMYEMMNDWVEQDESTDETAVYLAQIKQAEYIGDFIEQRIYNLINLTVFEQRINGFKVKDDFDNECLTVAKEAFALYQTYPNENVFRNAKPNGEVSEEDMENIIGMEKYISFYADHKGWLNETLIESVNTEMQEYAQMEEPIIQKQFDGRDITTNNLCFENRLFELLHRLSDILHTF